MEGSATIKTYRDLIAWQRAMDLAREVYRVTEQLPPAEKYGLSAQLRRAAVSIPSNIAEGHARGSTVDYARFLRMARGSFAELRTQLELAESLGLLSLDMPARDLVLEADRVLQALIKSIERKIDSGD